MTQPKWRKRLVINKKFWCTRTRDYVYVRFGIVESRLSAYSNQRHYRLSRKAANTAREKVSTPYFLSGTGGNG